MLWRCLFLRVWPKALFAGAIVALFLRDPQAIAIVAVILGLTVLQDLHAYGMTWEKHRELSLKFGDAYQSVLNEKLNEVGLEQLITGYWAEVRVALKNQLGLEKLP